MCSSGRIGVILGFLVVKLRVRGTLEVPVEGL